MGGPNDKATDEFVSSGNEILKNQLRSGKGGPEFLVKPPNVFKAGFDTDIAVQHYIWVVQLHITRKVSAIPTVACALERRSMILA